MCVCVSLPDHTCVCVRVSMKTWTQSVSNWIYKMHQRGINRFPWQRLALSLTSPPAPPPHTSSPPISFPPALSFPLIHLFNISFILLFLIPAPTILPPTRHSWKNTPKKKQVWKLKGKKRRADERLNFLFNKFGV